MPLQLREITSMDEARGFHGRRALVQWNSSIGGHIYLGVVRAEKESFANTAKNILFLVLI